MRIRKSLFILFLISTIFLTKFINSGKKGREKQQRSKKVIGQSSEVQESIENKQFEEHELKQQIIQLKTILDNWKGYEILNESYMEKPKTFHNYNTMVNKAINYLKYPIENLINENLMDDFVKKIENALQGRKLIYVRMIGLGSMFGHLNHYNYDDNEIGKTERIILIDKLNSNYQNKYLKSSQITAIFQFALGLSVIQYFNKIQNQKLEKDIKGKIHASSSSEFNEIIATFEEMHLNLKYEKKYLWEKQNIYGIKPKNKYINLKEIPEIVNKMENDEITLILMIQCPPEMTINIIDTYYSKNMLGNLIIVESALSYNLNIYNNYREYFSSSILAFPNYLLTQLFYLPTKTKIYYNKMKIENNKENENVED